VAIDRDKLLQSAAKLVDKKKYDKAIAEYRKIVQNDPSDARTLLKIGDIQSRMNDFAGAVQTYDRVATYYASQGFQLKAIAVFKQIRELIRKHAPELAARYSHITPRLADIYAELNLVTDALAAYDEVATSYQKAGRDLDAIEVFQKTVGLDPKNPLPHLRLAEARCRVKQLDEAIASFWTAAELLLGLRRPDDALKVIERILHFKQDPIYARAAAELYLKKGDAQAGMQALARLQIAFQANPKDLDTLALLAQAFEAINQSEKALEVHLEMARLARDQKKPELWAQIIAHLKHVAPSNDQVLALEKAGPPPGSQVPPPPQSVGPVSVEVTEEDFDDLDDDVEFLDDEEAPASELAPGPPSSVMPQSRPPAVSSPNLRQSSHDLGEADFEDDTDGVDVGDPSAVDAEERGAPQSFQPSSHAHKALSDAESFRSMGLLDKAVEALHIALELDPNSIPIRHKLREILVEAGEREPAIQETLNIAIIHVHNQEPDDAAPLAEEVLEIEPGHPDALNILEHVAALREAMDSIPDAEDGLQSYDMEGVRPSAAINDMPKDPSVPTFDQNSFDEGSSSYRPEALSTTDLDFEEEPAPSPAPSPGPPPAPSSLKPPAAALPSSLPAPALPPSSVPAPMAPPAAGSGPLSVRGGQRGSLPPLPSVPPPSQRGPTIGSNPPPSALPLSPPAKAPLSQPPASLTPPSQRPDPEAIEEVLEEAEFFAAQGLFSDAVAILTDMLQSAPNHVLLKERLAEVQAMDQGEENAGDTDHDSLAEDDNAFDIAASLDALDDLDEPETAPAMVNPDQEVDVDQVFAKFKEGVKAVVDDSDAATHYDLGLAYKEMGLHADACSEFEIASQDPGRACMCFAMMGLIYREQGDTQNAKSALLKGLAAEQRTQDQILAIEYDLCLIFEAEGAQKDYIKHLKSIAALDKNYRDVATRLRALGEVVPEKTGGDDDDFDAAFDNLLG